MHVRTLFVMGFLVALAALAGTDLAKPTYGQ